MRYTVVSRMTEDTIYYNIIIINLITLGVHAHKGYGTCVCVFEREKKVVRWASSADYPTH